jgi:ATP phosphoribosyltransferase regulatory subunit
VNKPWRRRLARTFGDPKRLRALVEKAVNGSGNGPGMDRKIAEKRAQALLSESGLGTIGSRTAKEIADRVAEKAALADGISERARKTLDAFLAIEGSPKQALKSLRTLAKRDKLDLDTVLDRFDKRLDAFAKRGVDTESLTFAADFGRRLDYYTGFVFEIHDPKRRDGRQIIGGGRYDRLVALIGRGQSIPAVGFAIWLDRIGRKS